MTGYVKSSPHFFRPVKRSMTLCVAVLLASAALWPAPLEVAADPAHAPNPARAAWFLVWIQELVSHSTLLICVAVALAAMLVSLAWLPLERGEHARWLQRRLWAVTAGVCVAGALVLALTIVGLWFRGENWRFVSPF